MNKRKFIPVLKFVWKFVLYAMRNHILPVTYYGWWLNDLSPSLANLNTSSLNYFTGVRGGWEYTCTIKGFQIKYPKYWKWLVVSTFSNWKGLWTYLVNRSHIFQQSNKDDGSVSGPRFNITTQQNIILIII